MNERIKKLRKALGLTQQDFADRIGVKRNTIANYEIDRNEPSGSVISLICKEFNVSDVWLRTGEGEMFIPMSRDFEIAGFVGRVLHAESDTFQKRFISMLSRLNEDEWEVLEGMVAKMEKEKD